MLFFSVRPIILRRTLRVLRILWRRINLVFKDLMVNQDLLKNL